MRDSVIGNRNVQKIFTLLSVCVANQRPLTDVLAESVTETAEYKLWRKRKDYEFVNDTARRIREELEELGVDNLKDLTVQQVYSTYPQLQEIKKLVDRTEKSIDDGTFESLDIVHLDWRGYLLKIARRRLLPKIEGVNGSGVLDMKRLKSPENGSVIDIVGFIKVLSGISEPNTTRENITNFHIANCFRIFTEPVVTEIPQRAEYHYDAFDPPFQNVAKNIPEGFFCISQLDYDNFAKKFHQ